MENAAKALEIAAGVLLGVMILSLIAYFFDQIGVWPQREDELETAEQLAKFNTEYEVYQKSAMYGVDVISCLNKAISNNQKYAESGSFFSGQEYGSAGTSSKGKNDRYYIDVFVNIKSNLEETIEVYYMGTDNMIHQSFEGETRDPNSSEISLKDVFKDVYNKDIKNFYTSFNDLTKLVPVTVQLTDESQYMTVDGGTELEIEEIGVRKKYYSLRSATDTVGRNTELGRLLSFSDNIKIVVSNNNNSKQFRDWSKATWVTALYSFKTKRFKCDYVGYSEVTGRVNRIYFSEI